MDIIYRLPGCSGQTADAVSVYTQVEMEDAPTVLEIPKSRCPGVWIRLPKHKWPKSWSSMEDPVVPLERNLYGQSSGRTIKGKTILESSTGTRLGKSFKLGMFNCQPSKRTIPINVCGRYQTGRQDRKHRTDLEILMNDVDPGEHTSLLDHVNWGCTHRESKISNDIVASYRDMFEYKISAGAKEKLPTRASGKPDAETISSWSCDMEGHAKKCVERCCELANKTTQQLYKVATPYMDDHQIKEEENESVGELSTVCSQIVLKCQYLARIVRPDLLWSVNKLARAMTKWTKACDER